MTTFVCFSQRGGGSMAWLARFPEDDVGYVLGRMKAEMQVDAARALQCLTSAEGDIGRKYRFVLLMFSHNANFRTRYVLHPTYETSKGLTVDEIDHMSAKLEHDLYFITNEGDVKPGEDIDWSAEEEC